jgi:hypothetical protein
MVQKLLPNSVRDPCGLQNPVAGSQALGLDTPAKKMFKKLLTQIGRFEKVPLHTEQ